MVGSSNDFVNKTKKLVVLKKLCLLLHHGILFNCIVETIWC